MQELKGAAWATIAAFARRAEFAPSLWERLLQEGVLAVPGPEGLTVSVPHYDMTYQLNGIEVRVCGLVVILYRA